MKLKYFCKWVVFEFNLDIADVWWYQQWRVLHCNFPTLDIFNVLYSYDYKQLQDLKDQQSPADTQDNIRNFKDEEFIWNKK